MKKLAVVLLAVMMMYIGTACKKEEPPKTIEPRSSEAQSICELAVMECYYYNVAKFYEKDAEVTLFWKKDKHFWVEYSGTVKLGLDFSRVKLTVDGTDVTIEIPEAKVLSSHVESASLSKDSYIVAQDSAAVTADDETLAFKQAQAQLEEAAANDKTLLAMAQRRAQKLLEDYVDNIGEAVGKKYTIQWEYLDAGVSESNSNAGQVELTEEEAESSSAA